MQVAIWDPMTDTERILTIADFQAQDWETMDATQLYNKLPIGMDMKIVVEILIGQLAGLSKKVKVLEDQVIDKMLLEDSPKP